MATATKNPARKTKAAARKTGTQARRTARQAERTLQTLISDTGYAVLGASDYALARTRELRKLPEELSERANRLQSTAREYTEADRLRELYGEFTDTLRDTFEEMVDRGRTVTGQVRRSPAVKAAERQVQTARSQVKAAATSVRKAAGAQVDAVEDTASKLGTEHAYEDMTVEQLYELASERDIDGRSNMTKQQLITALRKS